MKCSACLVVLATLLSAQLAPGQNKTITILNADKVTFNPARVDQNDLLHWLRLSQALIGLGDNYLLLRDISLCPEKDSRYQDCKQQWGSVPSVHNAKVNIAVMEEALRDLDTYPAGLSEVVAHARKWQEFGLWVAKAQLAYLESGSVSALEEKHGSVEPSVACGGLLEQIRNAKTTAEAWPLLHHDWWNCVLAQEREHIGEYPQQTWDAFLKANGVKEQPIPEAGD
jgi:hypothetical protein